MAGFLFFASVGVCLAATILGIIRHPRWYWAAAFASWLFSFLGSMSIGLYTFSTTVVLATLAAGHSFRLIRRFHHATAAVALGLGLWAALVFTVDDYWLFFPLNALLDLLLSGGSSGGGGSGTVPAIPAKP